MNRAIGDLGRAVAATDTSKSRVRNLKPDFIQSKLASAIARPYFAMSSSEDSEVSYTDYEYVIEAENDDDRDVSPPTSDDEATAFADDPLADAE